MSKGFSIFNELIPKGKKKIIEVPLPSLYSTTPMSMPVYIINGKDPGPVLIVTAAIHGDEVNGVEIVRRLYKSNRLSNLKGTLVAIPVVNLYGFTNLSRYLPDRRDLNRSFPGRETGSLAARIASIFQNEILPRADCIIDLHTGSVHRSNLPQIRSSMESKKVRILAKAFHAPIILKSTNRVGSFRAEADKMGIPFLLYEAGEALRLDEISIRYGLHGIVNVMHKMKMLSEGYDSSEITSAPKVAQSSSWLRAPISGILQLKRKLGQKIKAGERVGYIFDPFTTKNESVRAPNDGVIIGKNNLPLINAGDPIVNVACLKSPKHIIPDISEIEDYGQDYYLG